MLTDDKFENAESYQRQLIGRSGPTEWSIARLETMLELGVIMRVVPVDQDRSQNGRQDGDSVLETRAI